jgi:hypothetical protein
MTAKQALIELLDRVDEEEAKQILRYARFVSDDRQHEEWLELSLRGLARAYADDEPEYTVVTRTTE